MGTHDTSGKAPQGSAPGRTPLRRALGIGLAAVAVTGSIGYAAGGRRAVAVAALDGRVARLAGAGLTFDGAPLAAGDGLRTGGVVATDGKTRARLELADGTVVVLDRATRVALVPGARTMRLETGAVLVDVLAQPPAPPLRVATSIGTAELLGTKAAVTAADERTHVEVLRGDVRLIAAGGSAEHRASGQEGVVGRDGRIDVAPANDLAHRAAFGESFVAEHNEDADAPVSGLGELRARRPGRTDEKERAVRLARHAVKVRIAGSVARTEIDEEFRNDTDDELEGIYRFPLPPGAQIERLALEVDGKLVDGEFVDRKKAQGIWRGAIHNAAARAPKPREEIVWVPGPWHDPALLEWQRGGRFELRIFPIPKRASRRVVIAYTETVAPSGGVRRYVYPLPDPGSSGLVVDAFSVDAQVVGQDPAVPVRARGYELARTDVKEGVRLTTEMSRFTPSGDLALEYALPDRASDLTAVAYAAPGETDAYVSLALRPKLPVAAASGPRDQVIVVDVGRTMFGERLRRARRLAVQMAAEMDRRDRLTVLACDVTCRSMGGFVAPGATGAHDVDAFLAGVSAEGASDLVGAVAEAARSAGGEKGRDLRITLVTAGLATAGYRTADRVAVETRRALADVEARAAVVAVPVGGDADGAVVEEIARGGGGVVVPYAPGHKLEATALDVLAATYGVALRDVTVELPDGLRDVAPAVLAPIRAGSETRLLARMRGTSVRGDVVVRGTVAGEPYEARHPLTLEASTSEGNAFVPRLHAAARIRDLERMTESDASRKELVALSRTHAVPSRHTALLVLESEAMFQAFGIDRVTRATAFSGEVAARGEDVTALGPRPEEAEAAMDDLLGDGARAEEKKKAALAAPGDFEPRDLGGAGRAAPSPAPAPTMRAPAAKPRADVAGSDPWSAPPEPWARRRAPGRFMKRIWVRGASFDATNAPAVTQEKIDVARRAADAAPDERSKRVDLARLLAAAERLDELEGVLERWAERDPLDVEVLAARADLASRRGDRALALRILGGLLASPTLADADAARLARAVARSHERAGSPAACAFHVAAAERKPGDLDAAARAARCERDRGNPRAVTTFGQGLGTADRARLDKLLLGGPARETVAGDVVVSARWAPGEDLDVSVVDPRGRRAGVVSAIDGARVEDGRSLDHERVALTSSESGAFLVEVSRAEPTGRVPVSGTLVVRALGQTREIPFTLTSTRARVARVDLRWRPELVPLDEDDVLPFAR